MSINTDSYQILIATMLEAGSFVIPNILLKFYARLGITELELMVILHLLHWRHVEQERFPSPEKMVQYMNMDSETIKNLIASLIEKKLVAVEPFYNRSLGRWQNTFSFVPLWSKLTQMVLGDYSVSASANEVAATATKEGELYRAFEKEFGRPLSPLESDQLKSWLLNDQVPVELLQEGLRRAVLRGALNFRYIDSILRDWRRHNISTVNEAMAFDERRKKTYRQTRSEKKSSKKDKYRDLYRLNSKDK